MFRALFRAESESESSVRLENILSWAPAVETGPWATTDPGLELKTCLLRVAPRLLQVPPDAAGWGGLLHLRLCDSRSVAARYCTFDWRTQAKEP